MLEALDGALRWAYHKGMAEQAPVAQESFAQAVAADASRADAAEKAGREGKRAAFDKATGSDQPPLRRTRPAKDKDDGEADEGRDDADGTWQDEFNALLDPTASDDAGDADGAGEGKKERRSEKPDGRGIASLTVKQLGAIRRAGTLPDSVIEAMSAEDLSAYAEKELERQAQTDTLMRQKPSEGQQEPSRDTKGSEGKDSGGVAASDPPKPIDLNALVRPQLSVLGVDEADMPKLIAPLKAVQEQIETRFKGMVADTAKTLGEQNDSLVPARLLMLQLAQRAIAGELTSKWGLLRDPKVMRQVEADAFELYKESGAYSGGNDVLGGLTRAMEDAARRRLGDPDSASPQRRRGSSARSDSHGPARPDTSRSNGTPKKLTSLQKKQRIFRTVTGEGFNSGQRADLTLRDARVS